MSRRSWIVLGILVVAVFVVAIAAKGAGDKRQEWAKSGHANKALAVAQATVESRGATAAHCGRCHSEQGFLAWLPQLNKGNPGLIAKPDGSPADTQYLANLGLTKFSVRPQTCKTCHNDDYSIRVTQSTAVLPAGFRAIGVGLGAQCMTCHNTRNGAVAWNLEDPKRYTAPHTAAQADVIMGKNAFFVPPAETTISPHASFIGDSCVTCHVRFGKEGHTFAPRTDVCTRCHGPEMRAARVQDGIKVALHEVEQAIGDKVLARRDRIEAIGNWDPKTDQTVLNFKVDGSQITEVHLAEIHGQTGLKLTLRGGRELYSQLNQVVDASGKAVVPTSDPIVRAAWNFFLIEGDDSFGVHNPRFARAVLLATLDALK